MDKGIGLDGKRDGIFVKNVFATYTHIHASGERDWATCLIETARRRRFSELL
jgi:cobyrinic acid a,c-diamide synthase